LKGVGVCVTQLRRWNLYVLNGASCDCSGVEQVRTEPQGGVTSRGHLLVMGRRRDNRYVITHAVPFDRRADEFRRAMRRIRRLGETVCTISSRRIHRQLLQL